MLQVTIELPNSRVFLFPASAPREDQNAAPVDDVSVRGEVVITSDSIESTTIGPVKVVWEVARQRFRSESWQAREVLARFESDVTAQDTLIESGTIRLPFSIGVPSLLPPTNETPFDKTTHTILASVLESAPTYSLGAVPEYDSIDDFSIPSIISPRGSISGFSDYSFSRRSSSATEESSSRRGSVGVPVSPVGTRGSRSSSISSVLSDDSRRGSVTDVTEVDSRRDSVTSLANSASPSRRGSSDSLSSPTKKKGFFSSMRRKSSVSSVTSISSTASSPSKPVLTIRTQSSRSEIALPECLLPSTASSSRPIEIVSCPKPTGEICDLDWTKTTLTPGMGQSEKHVHSNLLSLGSAINFNYNLTAIPPKTTLHSLRLSLFQKTKAANGDFDEEVFELFSLGAEDIGARNDFEPPKDGQFVFRGSEARKSDATDPKSGKLIKSGVRPQAKHANMETGEDWMKLKIKARLPTPVIGGVPTSPSLLDDRLSRTKHRLRVEAYFSVLGENETGGPALPASRTKRTREGVWRKTWVDHDIVIGSCCVTPENIMVPTYSEKAQSPMGKNAGPTRSGTAVFDLSRHGSRTLKDAPTASAPVRPSRDDMHREISTKEVKTRLDVHQHQTDGKCLCFMNDNSVFEMAGSLDKIDSSARAQAVSAAEEERMRRLLGGLNLEKAFFVRSPDSPRNPVWTPVQVVIPQFQHSHQLGDRAANESGIVGQESNMVVA